MDCRIALLTLLDHVDYTSGACTVTEMVGAVLPEEMIALCRETAKLAADTAPSLACAECGETTIMNHAATCSKHRDYTPPCPDCGVPMAEQRPGSYECLEEGCGAHSA